MTTGERLGRVVIAIAEVSRSPQRSFRKPKQDR